MRAITGTMMILAVATAPVAAQPENVTDRWSIDIDAGFFTDFDDSGLWINGLGAGVTGLYALRADVAVCTRFGIMHWPFESDAVTPDLVPPGAAVTFEQSSGQTEVISLTPMIRYQREEVFPSHVGAFAQIGAGVAYVKQFALTEITYGPSDTPAKFEIDESEFDGELVVMAGVTKPVSSSSSFEVIASYHAIFADDTADTFGIGVGFAIRV
jgi:hypothetical protein